MFDEALKSPLRFFFAAAVLAAILCLYPARVQEMEPMEPAVRQNMAAPAEERPVGADISERTEDGCFLHRTLYYAPCGHSAQRREKLPAKLIGLTRAALESEISGVIPGAAVTGFSAREVDIVLSTEIPCPLHWVLRTGEDGMLHVLQNRDGESLKTIRKTDIPAAEVSGDESAALLEGKVFDDVQALEGYLESISS